MKRKQPKKYTGKMLMREVRKNNVTGVSRALRNGAPANYVDEQGTSVFAAACKTFDIKPRIINLLIENGALIEASYTDIQRNMEIAVEYDNIAAYEPLIKLGARVSRHILINTPAFKGWKREKLLIDLGEKYSRFEDLAFVGKDPAMPEFISFDKKEALSIMLARACERGDVVLAKNLIKEGADVNYNGDTYYSPILCCFRSDLNDRIVRILIKNGVDVNCLDDFGKTPLDYAITRRAIYTVAALFEAGALTSAELKRKIELDSYKPKEAEPEKKTKKEKPKWRQGGYYTIEEVCELYNVSREEAGERLGPTWITEIDGKNMIQGDDVYRAFEMNKGNNIDNEE